MAEPEVVDAEKIDIEEKEELDLYELYASWKALPTMMRLPPRTKEGARMDHDEFLERMGIDDPELVELAKLKTQGAFADHFGVNKDTLTRWNKRVKTRDRIADARTWANYLMSNALFMLYNKVMGGTANGMETALYFQVGGGWSPKLKLEASTRRVSKVIIEIVESNVLMPSEAAVSIQPHGRTYRLKPAA